MLQIAPTLILSFSSTTDAMAAESFCQKNQLPGRLIPLPSEISASCGLAWKARPEEEARILSAFTQGGIQWDARYILEL